MAQARLAQYDDALLGRSASMAGNESASNIPYSQYNSSYQQHLADASAAQLQSAAGHGRYDSLASGGYHTDTHQFMGQSHGRYVSSRLPGYGMSSESWHSRALCAPVFTAPAKSLEQIWKEGRQATTEAIYNRAHLQVLQHYFVAPAGIWIDSRNKITCVACALTTFKAWCTCSPTAPSILTACCSGYLSTVHKLCFVYILHDGHCAMIY